MYYTISASTKNKFYLFSYIANKFTVQLYIDYTKFQKLRSIKGGLIYFFFNSPTYYKHLIVIVSILTNSYINLHFNYIKNRNSIFRHHFLQMIPT